MSSERASFSELLMLLLLLLGDDVLDAMVVL